MNTGRLLILGAGGHGKVVADCAAATEKWQRISFFDDRWPTIENCGPWPVCGTGEDFLTEAGRGGEAFVAIGAAKTRLHWLRRLAASNISIATVIHPRAVVSPYASIGHGSLVVAGAVVNIDVVAGIGCIVNTGATVDHDCELGDCVHVCPGAHLAGNVQVGALSWIGLACGVLQGLRIGGGVVMGAGAIAVKDVDDGLTVVGVPACPVERSELSGEKT